MCGFSDRAKNPAADFLVFRVSRGRGSDAGSKSRFIGGTTGAIAIDARRAIQ
jgi:hypothetical protein